MKIGKVKIQNLSANIGSSVQRIEQNYGHIKPLEYAQELVRNQDFDGLKKTPNKINEELENLLRLLKENDIDIETRNAEDY